MLPLVVTPSDTPLFSRLPKKAPAQPAVLHQWLEDTLPASTDTSATILIGDAVFTAGDYTLYQMVL